MISVVLIRGDGTEEPVSLEEPMSTTDANGGPAPLLLTPTEREMPEPPPKPPRTRAPKGLALKVTVTKTVVKELTFLEADLKRLLRLPADAELELRTDDKEAVSLVASWTVTNG
jgi:hypothetical protein